MFAHHVSTLTRAGSAVLDLILPHRCALCGTVLGHERGLCPVCWGELRFISPPLCPVCGRPSAADDDPDRACVGCATDPPLLRRTRAALAYDDTSRRLVIAFKHYGRLSLRPLLATWVERTAGELIGDVDLVAPVPLHRWRLLRRGFNQSALLAGPLGRPDGPSYVPDLLVRHRPTASQQGLGSEARARNVTSAAFRVHPRHRAEVEGRRVLLVDDVLTTGATLAACARVLDRAGAAAVDAVCLARVTRPQKAPMS